MANDEFPAPSGGLTLEQALVKYVDAQLHAKFAGISTAGKERVRGEMFDALAGVLRAGDEATALGRPGSPKARLADIPAAEWGSLVPKDRKGTVYRAGKRAWHDVLFYERSVVEEWQYLKGLHERRDDWLTLKEALESLAVPGELSWLRKYRCESMYAWRGIVADDEETADDRAGEKLCKHYQTLDRQYTEKFKGLLESGDQVLWLYEEGGGIDAPRKAVPSHKVRLLTLDYNNSSAELGRASYYDVRVYPRGVVPIDGETPERAAGTVAGAEGRGDGDAAVERPAKGHAARAKVIGKCKQWLGGQAENGPGVKSKKEYQAEALQKFKGLSRRGFDTAWRMAVGDIPAWTKPGRKPRKNKP